MSCECETKKKFSILKGKQNLLNLIRGISQNEQESDDEESPDVIKTETLQDEETQESKTFEQNTYVVEEGDIEGQIELKRLEHILDQIERLRFDAQTKKMAE